jgi:hypothetical protein
MFKQGDKIVDTSNNFKIYTFDSIYTVNTSKLIIVYEDLIWLSYSDFITLSEYRKQKLKKLNICSQI